VLFSVEDHYGGDPNPDFHKHSAVLRGEWEEVGRETGTDGEFIN
jgi:hypothetical protein